MKSSENSGFVYTYSASEQEELKRIRSKYEKKEESKLQRLRRLDNAVTQKAQAVSLAFGIVGALILGLGMSLILSELGVALGILALPLGVFFGALGGVLVGLAYPMYNRVTRREREKIAPEVIRLTDELMK